MSDRYGDYFGAVADLFFQPYGPNTAWEYLGCFELPSVDRPLGEVTSAYCRGVLIYSAKGTPGRVTGSLGGLVGKTRTAIDHFIDRGCRGTLYVHRYCRAQHGVFLGFERGELYDDLFFTSEAASDVSMRQEDGAAPTLSKMTYNWSAGNKRTYFGLKPTRINIAGVHSLNDIAFCSVDECGGQCGPADYVGRVGYVVPSVDASAADVADVNVTTDYAVTWAQTVTDPFAAGESISAVVCVPISAAVNRVIVARGTTDAGNPAEIAYSDDGGVTWTNVNVGSTNGEFVPWNGGLFALKDTEKVWLCTDTGGGAAGQIYYSADAGETWTLQLTGATDALNCIHMANKDVGLCVGDTNELWSTVDAGITWSAVVGPAAQAAQDALSCIACNQWRFFVGYQDGELWYSEDGGVTWANRAIARPTGWTAFNAINAMFRVDDNCIWLAVHYTGAAASIWGALERTINGGYDWDAYAATVACDAGGAGLLSVYAISYDTAYGVGCLAGGTPMILKVTGG